MTGRRRFDPNELGTDRPDELDDALTAASWLDAAVDVAPVTPSAAFTDRVMAALADEPSPSSVGFLAPVRRRGLLAGFAASMRQAWASIGGGGRPVLARASALAYVLAVVIAGTSLAGVATIGLAGALGILGPSVTQSAPPQTPGPITSPDRSVPPPAESAPPPTVGESEEPSESPDASDDHGGISGSDSSGSDDGSGSDDSGSGSSTPEPSDTPRPTGTSKPSETPHS